MALPWLQSRTARWAVPLGAVTAIGLGIGVTSVMADAATQLAPKTAAQLLVDVGSAPRQPFSGTVVQTARLGLPELPGRAGSTSLQSLVSGSHTARVWYTSPAKARFSLVGDLAESDVIRDGRDVWTWSSTENAATHVRLPAALADRPAAAAPLPTDPASAAAQALRAIDPSTTVTVEGTGRVAGRSAYELVLAPRDARSLVQQVRLAVDGETSVPLRVQVFAKGGTEPAFETAFTAVQFERPADSVYTFTPPAGAKVREVAPPAGAFEDGTPRAGSGKDGGAVAPRDGGGRQGPAGTRIVGSGWTAVAVLQGVDADALSSDATAGAVLRATTRVEGSYGSGRLLRTPLLSVLLLDDGRALVGAVDPAVLEEAAASTARAR
jgi:outer membrane lipoprotein-sorting protein